MGGSNYYVESVLWDTLIKSKNTDSCLDDTNLTSSVDEFRKVRKRLMVLSMMFFSDYLNTVLKIFYFSISHTY